MKGIFLLFLLAYLWMSQCFAQKRALTEADLNNWPELNADCVSNDGHYVIYHVSRLNGPDTLYIRSLKDGFCKMVPGGNSPSFTEDSQEAVYLQHESLTMLDLGTQSEAVLAGVRSFKVPDKGNLPYVAYISQDNVLKVLNIKSGQRQEFNYAQDYIFSKSGKILLIFQKAKDTSKLLWLDLITGRTKMLWKGQPVLQYDLDSSEKKVAFVIGKDGDDEHCSVWEFDIRRDILRKVLHNTDEIEAGYSVSNAPMHYSPDGQRIFFGLYHLADTMKAKPGSVMVDVWNYKDDFLQCDQLNEVASGVPRTYLSVVDLNTRKVMRLEHEGDSHNSVELNSGLDDNYLVISTAANIVDGYRNLSDRPDIYLVDAHTGDRRRIAHQVETGYAHFSPSGKYIIWFDKPRKSLNFYNIQKGRLFAFDLKFFKSGDFWENVFSWTQLDQAILVGNRYDIWKIDPEGLTPQVDITHGYGQAHKIFLRLARVSGGDDNNYIKLAKPDTSILLCAFSEQTKENGFFSLKQTGSAQPKLISMGPYAMYFSGGVKQVESGGLLLKARDTDTYIVSKQTSAEYPNLQVTHDFRNFSALSDLRPEKSVNWLSTELVKWRTFDGRLGQGILYKPENFDPHKKYPIIFYSYELQSGKLNMYLTPALSSGPMNIPWFVSHGYLVFTPDIEYTMGDPGKGVYNYVVSAAELMQKKPWVDGARMGIQGHSFGGYEVSYLVTKTNLFAAACEASGISDVVSLSGEAGLSAGSSQWFTENSQMRMQVPLWQDKAAYIRNSPVFRADQVKTPLLMMHNKGDAIVAWPQAMEFFTALWRLGKPGWLLQYDKSSHGVSGVAATDLTRRMTQFFDHYLKGAPVPKWMAEGIPARWKGIDDGLELEPANLPITQPSEDGRSD